MSEREQQDEPETDESREPLLTPDHLTDAATEFRQEVLEEKAEHGLDQLDGPDIPAVMHREEGDEAATPETNPEEPEGEEEDDALDDLFDPPGYYDGISEGPARPDDADVGVRDAEVEGPRRQVGEAAHNPPIGEAPKQGEEEEEENA